MGIYRCIFVATVLLGTYGFVNSQQVCNYSPVRTETTVLGRIRTFCDYNITRENVTVSLSVIPGSKFRTEDCMECVCNKNGLKCCGLGVKAPMYVPQECTILADGCDPVLVLKADNSTDCYTGRNILAQRQDQELFSQILTGFQHQNRMAGQNGEGGAPLPGAGTGTGKRTPYTEEQMEFIRMMTIMPLLSGSGSMSAYAPKSLFGGSGPLNPLLMMSLFGGEL